MKEITEITNFRLLVLGHRNLPYDLDFSLLKQGKKELQTLGVSWLVLALPLDSCLSVNQTPAVAFLEEAP